MKKLIFTLITCLFCTSCRNHVTVGDYYIVTSIELYDEPCYNTKYKIIAKSVIDKANAYTIDGNSMIYYTNSFYHINDTIKLINYGTNRCYCGGVKETT